MNIHEAIILVGGKGTRLQSIINDRPKPMAEVAGRPFVEWLLLRLKSQGIQHIILCTNYLGEVIEMYFGNGRHWNLEIDYAREPGLLGTAGAVRHAVSKIRSDRFLVLNGDSYCHMDISRLEQIHCTWGARATLWLAKVSDSSRYGSVEIGINGVVQSFREKQTQKTPGFINAGVYLLERNVVEAIPAGCVFSIERDIFPQLIGHGLYAVAGDEIFLDIGTPESYAAAEQFFASHVLTLARHHRRIKGEE